VTHPDSLRQKFREDYGGDPVLCRAPGRVNLIGEHTDYNDGFVMPAAIDSFTWTAIRNREDAKINVVSLEEPNAVSITMNGALQPRRDWSDYVVGVLAELHQSGISQTGADLLVHGEVPIGAGLSSSAALEVSTGFAALRSHGSDVNRVELALLCQRAENQFVGTRCGIMDQFVSCLGKADHALMLDCRSLEFQLLPIPAHVRIVICNTMVRHSLAAGEYNMRREECETGVRLLAAWLPGVKALRDVSLEDFDGYAARLPELIARRCRHVISENDRVENAAQALKNGALDEFGRFMAESHRSLRDDYQVSCPELDLMVELAKGQRGVYGARMTGGGFGGCTVNLVESADAESFVEHMRQKYADVTGVRPDIYLCTAADGACEVQ
jgi:galactokinase